jgi:hypothetical protein
MASLNAIFNPTEKLKIKTLGFFNWDELDYFRNRVDNISFNNVNFTNIENYQLQNTNRIETSITNQFSDNVTFLDMTLTINEKLNFDLQSERYYFGNLANNNVYDFLDFDAKYTVKENKLILMLSGKNLFNTNNFRNFAISDIGTTTTEYRLLPRYVLLKVEYRF